MSEGLWLPRGLSTRIYPVRLKWPGRGRFGLEINTRSMLLPVVYLQRQPVLGSDGGGAGSIFSGGVWKGGPVEG